MLQWHKMVKWKNCLFLTMVLLTKKHSHSTVGYAYNVICFRFLCTFYGNIFITLFMIYNRRFNFLRFRMGRILPSLLVFSLYFLGGNWRVICFLRDRIDLKQLTKCWAAKITQGGKFKQITEARMYKLQKLRNFECATSM